MASPPLRVITLYRKGKPCGHGAVGTVRRVQEDGEDFAVKKVDKATFNPRELDCLDLGKHHKNMTWLIAYAESSKAVYVVMPYAGHDLSRVLARAAPLTAPQRKHVLRQLVEGLCFLHEHGIVHRDLKPQNILVGDAWSVRIADFGLARRLGWPPTAVGMDGVSFCDETGLCWPATIVKEHGCAEHGRTYCMNLVDRPTTKLSGVLGQQVYVEPLTELVGTLWYRAPEVLRQLVNGTNRLQCFPVSLRDVLAKNKKFWTYGSKVDIWSVGCIFAEFFWGEPLWQGTDNRDQLALIYPKAERGEHGKRPLPGNFFRLMSSGKVPEPAQKLLVRLLAAPSARCTADEALHDSYFT